MTPKQFFFGILGVTAVTLAASGYGYVYALHRLGTAKLTLATSLGQQVADQDQIDGLTRLKVQYAKEVVPELPLMDTALPHTKDQTALLVQLQSIAASCGLVLGSATFPSSGGLPSGTSQTTQLGAVLALPVSFDVAGSFQQLQSFLSKIETLNRFTSVTSLTVSRPDKTKAIDYSITLNAYVKP
ncbi:type 4a pilus biogenesis protein PilO [Candidatus Saccharibacteria bacterium]|nr:type 4a pilus biogenesis protein PilO [Candidatus Saccharibacteria bacterium]